MASRAAGQPEIGCGWVLTLPLVVLLGGLIFLAADRMHRPVANRGPSLGSQEWERSLPERLRRLQAAVRALPLELHQVGSDQQGDATLRWILHRYEATIEPEERRRAEEALSALQDVDPGVALRSRAIPGGVEVLVGLDGLPAHLIRFRWARPETERRVVVACGPLGNDLRRARAIVSGDAVRAVAVDPLWPFAAEVADMAHLYDRDVVLAPPEEMPPDPSAFAAALEKVGHIVAVLAPRAWEGEAVGALKLAAELRGLAWLDETPESPLQVIRLTHLGEAASLAAALADLPSTETDRPVLVVVPPVDGMEEELERAIAVWKDAGLVSVALSPLVRPTPVPTPSPAPESYPGGQAEG